MVISRVARPCSAWFCGSQLHQDVFVESKTKPLNLQVQMLQYNRASADNDSYPSFR